MPDILADRTCRHLFGAQVAALLGTGLAMVASGPLACDLAGEDARRRLVQPSSWTTGTDKIGSATPRNDLRPRSGSGSPKLASCPTLLLALRASQVPDSFFLHSPRETIVPEHSCDGSGNCSPLLGYLRRDASPRFRFHP
jgi:hypothetical protein